VATGFVATSFSESDGSGTLGSVAKVLRRNPHVRFFNSRRGYRPTRRHQHGRK